jgi:hypothetical protein
MLKQLYFKVPGRTRNGLYFRECFELNIQMPADLDQFW